MRPAPRMVPAEAVMAERSEVSFAGPFTLVAAGRPGRASLFPGDPGSGRHGCRGPLAFLRRVCADVQLFFR